MQDLKDGDKSMNNRTSLDSMFEPNSKFKQPNNRLAISPD